MGERPLDFLDKRLGKRVMVELKDGRKISGVLRAFDLHLNTWMDDAEYTTTWITEDEKGQIKEETDTIKLGSVMLRGDSIVMFSGEK